MGWDSVECVGRATGPVPLPLLFLVFDFVGAFGVVGGMLDSLLRLGFFHRPFGFFRALGTDGRALLALFLLQLLTAQEFNERGVGAVALSPADPNDAQVSSVAVPETGSDGIEKLVHRGTRHQVRQGLAARRQIATLAQRDHLLHQGTHGLGLGHRGFDSFFGDERSHQVPQQ